MRVLTRAIDLQAQTTATLLAHQGGWDEALLVAAAIGLFIGLLWAANERGGTSSNDGAPQGSDEIDRR
jgi:hypothetical protein